MSTEHLTEEVRFIRPEAFPEAELMVVKNSRTLWKAFHEKVGICTCLNTNLPRDSHAAIRYTRGQYELARGSLALFEPGDTHVTERITDPGTFLVLHLDSKTLEDFARSYGLRRRPHFKDIVTEHPSLFQCLYAFQHGLMHELPRVEQQHRYEICLGMLFRLSCERQPEPIRIRRDPRRLATARDYIHAYYNTAIHLEDIAKHCGLSPYYLNRSFREHVGVPPHQYLMLVRLARAKQLLAEGRRPVAAALEVGFYEESHMLKYFKRAYGISPGRYQRAVRS